MGRVEIEFSKQAARQYSKLPKEYRRLIDVALFRLSQGLELDLKPVQGRDDIYRIRVGKYRILFAKLAETALVFRIYPRGDVYKR